MRGRGEVGGDRGGGKAERSRMGMNYTKTEKEQEEDKLEEN